MSYILDALKKAERERTVAQVPNLMSVHDSQASTPRRNIWIVAGICLVCAAAIVIAALTVMKPSGGQVDPPAAELAAKESNPPLQSTDISAAPPQTEMTPDETSRRETTAGAAPLPSKSSRQRPSEESSAANMPARPVPEPTHVPAARQEPAPEPPRNTAQPQTAVRSTLPSATESAPAPEAAQPAPSSLREAMAKMTMTILMYSDVQSERMAFINDRKYVEGEYVDGRYLLEKITPEGALLSYQGERALLRSKAK